HARGRRRDRGRGAGTARWRRSTQRPQRALLCTQYGSFSVDSVRSVLVVDSCPERGQSRGNLIEALQDLLVTRGVRRRLLGDETNGAARIEDRAIDVGERREPLLVCGRF